MDLYFSFPLCKFLDRALQTCSLYCEMSKYIYFLLYKAVCVVCFCWFYFRTIQVEYSHVPIVIWSPGRQYKWFKYIPPFSHDSSTLKYFVEPDYSTEAYSADWKQNPSVSSTTTKQATSFQTNKNSFLAL